MNCSISVRDSPTDNKHRMLHQSIVWPMNELADPTMGWSFTEVLNTNAGNAVHNVYGKLYAHVDSIPSKFKQRLSDTGARFELHQTDLVDLQDVYTPATFDRIEVRVFMVEGSTVR
jgi:hypothetical protein